MSDFFSKYPTPWTWEQTDPRGHGVLKDANGRTLVYLCTDQDWDDADGDETPAEREPVFNVDSDDRAALLEAMLTKLNQ